MFKAIFTAALLILCASCAYAHDSRDFSDRYNTSLNYEQGQEFRTWVERMSVEQGRNVLLDMYDYDLQGAWLDGCAYDGRNGHMPDTYKKPNHPTFSVSSIYAGIDRYRAGTWTEQDGIWTYQATTSNMYSKDELIEYFEHVEVKARLTFEKQ